jgi:drug/metabolite transporter (DMT)-like permease
MAAGNQEFMDRKENSDVQKREGRKDAAAAVQKKRRFWSRLPVVLAGTFFSCFLWGSAFPCVKIGYRLFSIGSGDTASQMLFAGIRFTLAGILVVLFGSLMEKRLLRPKRGSGGTIVILSLFQTTGQYFFFYIGLAHASGVNSSIIIGSGTFIAILIAAFLFRTEKMTWRKTIGSLLGFAGVMMVELRGSGSLHFHFSLLGEGCVLLSTVMAGLSTSYMKQAGQKEDPAVLSAYQFLLGGLMLTAYGLLRGGQLHSSSAVWKCVILIVYMAFISAAAYTIWSILLKFNPVSRITVFGFMNPVIGVLLSAVLLGETGQAFRLSALGALALISAGIIIVNRSPSGQKPRAREQSAAQQ